MMTKKNVLMIGIMAILGFAILYGVSVLGIFIEEAIKLGEVQTYYLYKIPEVLGLALFGMLIEYKRVLSLFKNEIRLNWFYLIVSIFLLIILIPPFILSSENLIAVVYANIKNNSAASSALAVFAGILFVRSLSYKKLEEKFNNVEKSSNF